jgi:hypothetical protein
MQFDKFLPEAQLTGEFQKAPGINIDGSFCRNALVNVIHGDAVPTKTYTIGVNGRGSLVMEEQEFRDLLASMALLFDSRQPGYVPKSA